MEKSDWRLSIKAKRGRLTLRALIFVIGVEALWLGILAVGVWAWVYVFHRLPPGRLLLEAMVALGTLIVVPLSAIAPLAPMRGKDPELIAADEFSKRRHDDQRQWPQSTPAAVGKIRLSAEIGESPLSAARPTTGCDPKRS